MDKKKVILAIKTKYGVFQCVFEPEKDMGGYMVEARGVQGAISWGKSLAEAKRMVVDAIEGAIEASVIAEATRRGDVRVNTKKEPIQIA